MSAFVEIGVFYDFIPLRGYAPSKIEKGFVPEIEDCHIRSELLCTLDQSTLKKVLFNPANRKRKDIWWIEKDGSNVEEVVNNIKDAFLKQGVSWFKKFNDLRLALREIEKERDCYNKFYRAVYFAKQLRNKPKLNKYKRLFNEESDKLSKEIITQYGRDLVYKPYKSI